MAWAVEIRSVPGGRDATNATPGYLTIAARDRAMARNAAAGNTNRAVNQPEAAAPLRGLARSTRVAGRTDT
jgi:hypothetical protein